jgi:hypothetical protein
VVSGQCPERWPLVELRFRNRRKEDRLFLPHPVVRVPLRHVREDHLVAHLQALRDFNRAHGTAAEVNSHANRRVTSSVRASITNYVLLVFLHASDDCLSRARQGPIEDR